MKKKNFIVSLLMFMSLPLAAMSWGDNDGIFDLVPSRDLYAVKAMLEDNCKMLHGFDMNDKNHFNETIETFKYLDTMIGKFLVQTYGVDLMYYMMNSHPHNNAKVLRKGGKTIGYIAYFLRGSVENEPFTWRIETLVIDEKYRRQGYGSEMVQNVSECVKVYGADNIVMFCPESNLIGQKFCEKNGFNACDGRSDSLNFISNQMYGFCKLIKIIDDKNLDKFNAIQSLQTLKAAIKECSWFNVINGDVAVNSIQFNNYIMSWINNYIESVDNLTMEIFSKLKHSESFLKIESFDFDDYKIKIKIKLEKIKSALELEASNKNWWNPF